MKVKTLSAAQGVKVVISNFPNFSESGSVQGMKEKHYGADALLVRCEGYIYDVTSMPIIYHIAR